MKNDKDVIDLLKMSLANDHGLDYPFDDAKLDSLAYDIRIEAIKEILAQRERVRKYTFSFVGYLKSVKKRIEQGASPEELTPSLQNAINALEGILNGKVTLKLVSE